MRIKMPGSTKRGVLWIPVVLCLMMGAGQANAGVIDDVLNFVKATWTKVKAIETDTRDIQTKIGEVRGSIDVVKTATTTIDTATDAIASTVNTIDTKTGAIQTATSAIRNTTSNIQGTIVTVGSTLNNVKGSVDDVKNTLDALKPAIENSLQGTIGNVQSAIENVKGNIDTVQGTLDELPSAIQFQMGIDMEPDGPIITQVKDALEEIKTVIVDHQAAVADFEGAPCNQFRNTLEGLFVNATTLSSRINTLSNPVDDLVDLGDLSLLDSVPCKVLMGLSIAFEETPLSDLVARLDSTSTALQDIKPLFVDALSTAASVNGRYRDIYSEDAGITNHSIPDEVIFLESCEGVPANYRTYRKAGLRLLYSSLSLQSAALVIDSGAVGKVRGLSRKLIPRLAEFDAGPWGFAHVTARLQELSPKIAKGLTGTSVMLSSLSSYALNKVTKCLNAHNQRTIFDNQQTIMHDQAYIIQLLEQQMVTLPTRENPYDG